VAGENQYFPLITICLLLMVLNVLLFCCCYSIAINASALLMLLLLAALIHTSHLYLTPSPDDAAAVLSMRLKICV
jgi:hypothetical protein